MTKPVDTELSPDAVTDNDAPPTIAPAKSTRAPNGIYEFREERWVELYKKKIEEMIGVLKSKGVPVLWVGLPVVYGPKATADTLFLNSLYRDVAGKAGITYVDVWDGFVDEAGHFVQKGPDFEGQIRQLRSSDGVYFTKAGARKLAHYVEREITRLLAARSAPITLPTEPATPDANAVPGQPAPQPLAGPILPLVASSVGTDQLLGGPGTRPAAVDALAARTLVKGEALTPPPAAPMIFPGRAAKSEANRPRVRSNGIGIARCRRQGAGEDVASRKSIAARVKDYLLTVSRGIARQGAWSHTLQLPLLQWSRFDTGGVSAPSSKQVAGRALRREGDARPLDRAGVVAPSAFDTTIGLRCIGVSVWRRGLFHCIHRSGDIIVTSAPPQKRAAACHGIDGTWLC